VSISLGVYLCRRSTVAFVDVVVVIVVVVGDGDGGVTVSYMWFFYYHYIQRHMSPYGTVYSVWVQSMRINK
jgi:hypothetical protein